MKQNLKNLIGFTMGAYDGEIGKVKDFYFDDSSWVLRYLIVETGGWFQNKKVLISPEAVIKCDWENKIFSVNLTKDQIEKSPDIDADQPVYRQHEKELYAHYVWTNYWIGDVGNMGMLMQLPPLPEEEKKQMAEAEGNPHLRSAKKVQGYAIHAIDESIGDVEDFVVNESNWGIDYIIVDTGHWLPGKKVAISPHWVKGIDWQNSEVNLNVLAAQVKTSPEYDQLKNS